LLERVLVTAREAGCERLLVVVGHGATEVRRAAADWPAAGGVDWVLQEEQRGTGHALAQVAPHLAAGCRFLVLSGDVPLIRAETLRALDTSARGAWGAMAVARLAAPGALGRVVARPGRDGEGLLLEGIVEAGDASAAELANPLVNAGLYCLAAPAVFERLAGLTPDNVKGELYLTDALTAAAREGERIRLLELADPEEAWGINSREDLARAERLARAADGARRATTGRLPSPGSLDFAGLGSGRRLSSFRMPRSGMTDG
jgi:bifunctional UDP-N-acetylglucosamine pyrophosphorylase/glucosamine-1-phosphate N-acetyltransferase